MERRKENSYQRISDLTVQALAFMKADDASAESGKIKYNPIMPSGFKQNFFDRIFAAAQQSPEAFAKEFRKENAYAYTGYWQ